MGRRNKRRRKVKNRVLNSVRDPKSIFKPKVFKDKKKEAKKTNNYK